MKNLFKYALLFFISISYSQKAVEKLGAILTETTLNEETGKTHFTFTLTKKDWI